MIQTTMKKEPTSARMNENAVNARSAIRRAAYHRLGSVVRDRVTGWGAEPLKAWMGTLYFRYQSLVFGFRSLRACFTGSFAKLLLYEITWKCLTRSPSESWVRPEWSASVLSNCLTSIRGLKSRGWPPRSGLLACRTQKLRAGN
jgi:hypothetical protein